MSGAAQYLLAGYILGHQDEPPIRTNAVAEMLDRSPATVTETFQRLDREELVAYESYKGVSLTDAGRERAAELHASYVTVSWFFRSVLDLEYHEVEAMNLAGLVSPTVAQRIAATLPSETDILSKSGVGDAPTTTDNETS